LAARLVAGKEAGVAVGGPPSWICKYFWLSKQSAIETSLSPSGKEL